MNRFALLLITLIFSYSGINAQTAKVFTSKVQKIGTISKTTARHKITFYAGKSTAGGQTTRFVRLAVTNQKQVYTITHDQYIFCVPQYFEFTIYQRDYGQIKKLLETIKAHQQKGQATVENEYSVRLGDGTIIRYSYPSERKITIISGYTAIPVRYVGDFTKYLILAINRSYKL